ncbi:MAG: tetratricopeptide repeat protein [Geminicoccaceae bacterium]|nr:tetratricopeptide repeat protein [Geminicoccaceae bacterium]
MRVQLRTCVRVALLLLVAGLPATGRAQLPPDPYAIGLEHFYAGRYTEALPYFVTALDQSEERFGEGAPETATDLNNLAELYRLLGRYDEAEPLYLRALALDEAKSGTDDPNLAASLNNLALLHRAQGRNDDAERLYKRSLRLLEDAYGHSHPQVAMSLNNLAMLYVATDHPERARPLLERAEGVARDTLGPTHPSTLRIAQNLRALDGGTPAGTDPLGFELRPSPRPGSTPLPAPAPAAVAAPEVAASPPEAAPTAASGDVVPVPAPPIPEPAPEVAVAAVPAVKPPLPRGFAIHLASVRSPAAANEEWTRLATELDLDPRIRQVLPQRVEVPGKGVFYRVEGGPFATRAEAAAACAPLAAAGQYCAVIESGD